MAGARPKRPAPPPRPLECSRDHVLVYDRRLTRPNAFRAIRLGDRHVRLEALVKLGAAATQWVWETAQIVDRETPPPTDAPSLVRAGSGDGSAWRIPPWAGWEPKYEIPFGTSFLLIQAPPVLPESWA
jgi:hypothetical protein